MDIDDSHQTLTSKTIAAIMWAIGYCGQHFSFLLKTYDDSFNILQLFVEYLDSLADGDMDDFNFVGGFCSSSKESHRDSSYIWPSPHISYPGSVLPYHCKVSIVQELHTNTCFILIIL